MANLDSFDKEETAATSAISLHREIFKGRSSVTHPTTADAGFNIQSRIRTHISPKNTALNKMARSASVTPDESGKTNFWMGSTLKEDIVSKDPKSAMVAYNHIDPHLSRYGVTSATYHLKKKQVTLHHPIGKDVSDVQDAVKRNKWKHKVIKGTKDAPLIDRFTHPAGGLSLTLIRSSKNRTTKGIISSTHVWRNADK